MVGKCLGWAQQGNPYPSSSSQAAPTLARPLKQSLHYHASPSNQGTTCYCVQRKTQNHGSRLIPMTKAANRRGSANIPDFQKRQHATPLDRTYKVTRTQATIKRQNECAQRKAHLDLDRNIKSTRMENCMARLRDVATG